MKRGYPVELEKNGAVSHLCHTSYFEGCTGISCVCYVELDAVRGSDYLWQNNMMYANEKFNAVYSFLAFLSLQPSFVTQTHTR